MLRIFQCNELKLGKDLIFSGLVQNVNVYLMAKSKKILPFRFLRNEILKLGKNACALIAAPKNGVKTVEL